MSRQTAIAGRCHGSCDVAIVACTASCAVVLEARQPMDPCRSYGKRTEHVSHSSLDGAQNARPTTAHRHPFFVLKREKQEPIQ